MVAKAGVEIAYDAVIEVTEKVKPQFVRSQTKMICRVTTKGPISLETGPNARAFLALPLAHALILGCAVSRILLWIGGVAGLSFLYL